MFETQLTVSYDGHDDWGIGLGLHNIQKDRIGSITYRSKTYLNNLGYPDVNEFHIGFLPEYQGKGYFEDALIELLKYDDTPVYICNNRVINTNVFKAINKLDVDIFNIVELFDLGYIITLKRIDGIT